MLDRLFNILKAYSSYDKKAPKRDSGKEAFEEFYSDMGTDSSTFTSSSNSQYSQQLIDDLAVFGLTPPSSFDEVKKARNQEMRKYHPDKFNSHNDKNEAANEIAQIYNDAFSRLKEYYGDK